MWSRHNGDKAFFYKRSDDKHALLIIRWWRSFEYGWIVRFEGSSYLKAEYYIS